ncbi:hypothetical protein [Algoriphagus sp.]|uniref:hypothetical protein n=1 Tax=Algoriphagus sp. TaxID=1872435 RepID=UPI00391CDB7A
MKAQESVTKIFPNLGYWLMLFVPLTFGGFYFTYFTKIQFNPPLIHVHFSLMAAWMVIAITQPLLIRNKKFLLHRSLGKLSYLLLPMVILSTWIVMKNGYLAQLAALDQDFQAGLSELSYEQGKIMIASFSALTFVYLFWLSAFYGLGVGFRKNASIHARFMIAAVLTFLGPTLDRTLYFWFGLETMGFGVPIEAVSFIIIDLILFYLLFLDVRNKKSTWPILTALALYISLQIFYLTLTQTPTWEKLISFLLT